MDTKQFCRKHNVRMSCKLVDENPNMPDGDMPYGSLHYKCVLRMGRRQMTTYFSMGPALCREPNAEDVLDCLASDAATCENSRSFEEWCSDLGFDSDSRKAERVYRAVEQQSKRLRQFSGELYDRLLWDTERL